LDTLLTVSSAIVFLTSRANAIKMLQSRIAVITAYLKAQPKSYLTDSTLMPSNGNPLDHSILRSISALEAQLRLASPADVIGISEESEQSKTDVELISLLSALTNTVSDFKSLNKHWSSVEPHRRSKMNVGQFLSSTLPEIQAEDSPFQDFLT
jgi:COP9 signalosome complex subunit 6